MDLLTIAFNTLFDISPSKICYCRFVTTSRIVLRRPRALQKEEACEDLKSRGLDLEGWKMGFWDCYRRIEEQFAWRLWVEFDYLIQLERNRIKNGKLN